MPYSHPSFSCLLADAASLPCVAILASWIDTAGLPNFSDICPLSRLHSLICDLCIKIVATRLKNPVAMSPANQANPREVGRSGKPAALYREPKATRWQRSSYHRNEAEDPLQETDAEIAVGAELSRQVESRRMERQRLRRRFVLGRVHFLKAKWQRRQRR